MIKVVFDLDISLCCLCIYIHQTFVHHLIMMLTLEWFQGVSIAEGHVLMETSVTIVYRRPGINAARLLLVHSSCNTVMVSTIFAAAQMMMLSVTKDTYILGNVVFVISRIF